MTRTDLTNPADAILAFLAQPASDDPADRRIADAISGHNIVLSSPLVLGAVAKIIIRDFDDGEEAYLAILEADTGGSWRVRSLDFRCATCFGELIHFTDGSPCSTCGATGWGLADVRESTDDRYVDLARLLYPPAYRVTSSIIGDTAVKFCVYEPGDSRFDRPTLVVLSGDARAGLFARCPVCSGSGIADGGPCSSCLAGGWMRAEVTGVEIAGQSCVVRPALAARAC